MTFFEEVQKITEKALVEKEKIRIKNSKEMILKANDGIKENALLGRRVYFLPYDTKDCDITYIKEHYQQEGFSAHHEPMGKVIVISW